MKKKKNLTTGDIKAETNKKQKTEDLDYFTRVSYLIAGKIEPTSESDKRILEQAKEIEKKGYVIEIPFD